MLLPTVKETAKQSLISHQLLLKAGFIRKVRVLEFRRLELLIRITVLARDLLVSAIRSSGA